jgi:hypothetical protein
VQALEVLPAMVSEAIWIHLLERDLATPLDLASGDEGRANLGHDSAPV